MKPAQQQWIFKALMAIALLAGVAAVIVFAIAPRPKRFGYTEGRPLLTQDEKLFTDSQVGLQFMPPADWSMQARSMDAPNHRPERLLVKYKRLLPKQPVAWLRVRIADVADNQSPGAVLQRRKPPESDWKPVKNIEDDFRVGGQPAARMTFSGPFDPDGRGSKEHICEIVAVRYGPQILEFAGTFLTTDSQARQQIRTAIDSIVFGK